MKKLICLFVTLFVVAMSIPSFAASKKEVVFVKLKDVTDGLFVSMPEKASQVKKMAVDEAKKDTLNTVDGKIRYSFTEITAGFSMEIDKNDIEKIAKSDYVEKVIVLPRIIADKPSESTIADPQTCCDIMNIPYAHELGYLGKGGLVAVIDGSFDSGHDFFAQEAESPKIEKETLQNVIESKGLNAVLSSDALYKNSKLPFVYNYSLKTNETQGVDSHGTHVAGIVAGKNGKRGEIELNGVAPESQIALMAVEDQDGYMYIDSVLAAMEDCIKIGADVVNISLGISYGELVDIFDEAVTNMKNAGVVVCAAAGNDSRGYLKGDISPLNIDYAEFSSPASAKEVVSVANAVAPSAEMIVSTMKCGNRQFSYANGDVSLLSHFGGKKMEFVYCGLGRKDEVTQDLTGKIALVRRGEITFIEKAENVKNAGACALIVANNSEALFNINCGGVLPSAVVTKSIGEFLANSDDAVLDINASEELIYLAQSGYSINANSGWGTGMDLELKPDISTPGTQILSSVTGGEYQLQSGTSMSTPHYAGVYLLVNEYVKKAGFEPLQDLAQNIIMSSARILRNEDTNIPYSPRNQGAGLADVKAALNTKVILKGHDGKGKLSLGENLGDEISFKIYAQNITQTDVTFDKITVEVMTDDITQDGYVGKVKSIPFSCDGVSEITVEANSEKEIEFNITLDSEATKENLQIFENGFFVDGYVIMKKSGTDLKASIPFTGFYGDWEKAPLVDLPWYEDDSFYSVTGLYGALGSECNIEEHDCSALGVNTFAVLLSEENPKIDPMDYSGIQYAGFSPNGDALLDSLCITSFTMRPCYDLDVTITDKDQNVIYTDTKSIVDKYLLICSDADLSIAEGDYTARISGVYASDNNTKYELDMPFYVDTTKPVIDKIEITQDNGRKLLKVNASDNRYIMGIELIKDGNILSLQVPVPSDKAEFLFDITGLMETELEIYVTDFAYNTFSAGVTGLEARIEKPLVFGDKSAVAIADFVNLTGDSITADIFAVLYDENGNMKDVSLKKGEQILPQSSTKLFELENVASGDVIKIITVESSTLAPLCKYAEKKAVK